MNLNNIYIHVVSLVDAVVVVIFLHSRLRVNESPVIHLWLLASCCLLAAAVN